LATEAALSFGGLAHNLIVLFERKLGWLKAVTLGSLRYWMFVTAGIISRPQGKITIKLALPSHKRDWWPSLWKKFLSSFPNCNAVGPRPVLAWLALPKNTSNKLPGGVRKQMRHF
jgi:hypothetical protein